jgi:Ca-activated chloride channel family protein
MTDITLEIIPQRSALLEGHATEIHALVRVRAATMPDDEQTNRKPLNLALVLDRSASMQDHPMEQAKLCAEYIVDQLGTEDYLSLVVYDNEIDVLIPSQAVANKEAFKQTIREVYSRGSTALFEGWQQGAQQTLRADVPAEYISRVLLLSDGCANRGLTEPDAIATYCAEMAEQGVSTSTYGLGTHFNEDLMVTMARAGQGQSYYGESADDLMDPFQEEFSLLSAVCARKLRLELNVPRGVDLEVLNEYPQRNDNTWILQDLAYEGEVWALLKLTIPADLDTDTLGDMLRVLNAQLRFEADDGDHSEQIEANLYLPRAPLAAWNTITEQSDVTARLQELQVARLQQRARTAAQRGDWRQVDRILREAKVLARENPWVEQSIESIERYAKQRDQARMTKEALYSARKLTDRMVSASEDAAGYDESEESHKAMYLRKKKEQGKRMDKRD